MSNLKSIAKAISLLLILVLNTATASAVSFNKMSLMEELPVLSTTEITSDESLKDQIAIRAINPGYTIGDAKNSGELIELVNLTEDELALDHLAIIYTAKPASSGVLGKSTILYRFPVGSRFAGQSILLRYKSAPEAQDGAQDLTYDTSLAMYGSLSLVQTVADTDFSSIPATSPLKDFGEVLSTVCWLGGEDCLPYFSTTVKSRSYTTILRDDETGEYAHVNDPELLYDPENPGLYLPPETETSASAETNDSASTSKSAAQTALPDPQCAGLRFSEILSYYDADASEQFIEFYNSTDEPIKLSGCKIRYKNKLYDLVEAAAAENTAATGTQTVVAPSDFYVVRPAFRLTKNPTTENILELIDVNGEVAASVSFPHGQKKSASYALISYNVDGSENWQVTYAQTPGAANVYQEYRSCPEGKIINEATGNCIKASTVSTTLKDCGEGKYRNPTTGRCKSYDTETTSECKEGYERNPETNRCRKIKSNDGAEYPVVPLTNFEEKSTFIALWALGGIAAIGAGYVAFQFRKEIAYFFKKVLKKAKK